MPLARAGFKHEMCSREYPHCYVNDAVERLRVAVPSSGWPHLPARDCLKLASDGHDETMNADDAADQTGAPTPPDTRLTDDPEAFRKAHEKYGGYLKEGGLPFEPEELDDDEPASDSPS